MKSADIKVAFRPDFDEKVSTAHGTVEYRVHAEVQIGNGRPVMVMASALEFEPGKACYEAQNRLLGIALKMYVVQEHSKVCPGREPFPPPPPESILNREKGDGPCED